MQRLAGAKSEKTPVLGGRAGAGKASGVLDVTAFRR